MCNVQYGYSFVAQTCVAVDVDVAAVGFALLVDLVTRLVGATQKRGERARVERLFRQHL